MYFTKYYRQKCMNLLLYTTTENCIYITTVRLSFHDGLIKNVIFHKIAL